MVNAVLAKMLGLLQAPPPIFLGDPEAFHMERYTQRLEDVLYTPDSSTVNVDVEHFSYPESAILCFRVMQLQLLYNWIMNDDVYIKDLKPFVEVTQRFLEREENYISGTAGGSSSCPVIASGDASAWESSAEEALASASACTDSASKFQLFLSRLSLLAALPRQIYRQFVSCVEEKRYREAHRRLASWEQLHAVLLLHPSFKDRRRAYELPPSLSTLQSVGTSSLSSAADWVRASGVLEQYQEAWLPLHSPHRLGVPSTSHGTEEPDKESFKNTSDATEREDNSKTMTWPSKRIALEKCPFPGIRPLLPFFQQEALERRYPEFRDIEQELSEAYRELEGLSAPEGQDHVNAIDVSRKGSDERERIKALHRLMADWAEASGIQALDDLCQSYEDAKKVKTFILGVSSSTMPNGEMENTLSKSFRKSISLKIQGCPTWRAVQLALPYLVQTSHENWMKCVLSDDGEIARHKKHVSVVNPDTAVPEEGISGIAVSTIAIQERVKVITWMSDPNIFRYWMLSCLTADHPERGPNSLQMITSTLSTAPSDIPHAMERAWGKECGIPSVGEEESCSDEARLDSLNRLYFPMDVIQTLGFPSLLLLVNVQFHYYEHLNHSPSGYHEGVFDAIVYDETNEKVLCVLLPPSGAYAPRLIRQVDHHGKMDNDGLRNSKIPLPPTEAANWIRSKQDMWRFVAALRSALAVSAAATSHNRASEREGHDANAEDKASESDYIFHCEGEVAEFIFDPPAEEDKNGENESVGNKEQMTNPTVGVAIDIGDSFKGKEEQFYCVFTPPQMVPDKHRVSIPLHAWKHAVQVPPQFFKTNDSSCNISLSLTAPQCSVPSSSDRKSSSDAFPLSSGSAAAVLYKQFREMDEERREAEKINTSKATRAAEKEEVLSGEECQLPAQGSGFVCPAPPPPLLSSYSAVVQSNSTALFFDALTLFRKLMCGNRNDLTDETQWASLVQQYTDTLKDPLAEIRDSSILKNRACILEEMRQYLLEIAVAQPTFIESVPSNTLSHENIDSHRPTCDEVPFLASRRQALQRELEEEADFWLAKLGDPDAPPAPRSSSTLGGRSGSATRHRRTPLRRGDSHGNFQLPSMQLRSSTPVSEGVKELATTPPPAGASAPASAAEVRTPLQVLAELLRRKGCSHPLLEMAKRRVTHLPSYGARHGSTPRGSRRSRRSSITLRQGFSTSAGGMEDQAEEEVEVAWF